MAINANEVKWAELDVNDPSTGVANKITPTLELQNDGIKRGEMPPRSYINYQFSKYKEFFEDLQNQINALSVSVGSSLLQQIFHVGSLYYSTSDTSPATRLGFGTWERVKGKFIVGLDEDDTNFDGAGEVGGSKTHSHTNSLTVNSAGVHSHSISRDGWGVSQVSGALAEPSVSGRLVTGSGKSEVNEELESLAHSSAGISTGSSGAHIHTLSGGITSASNVPPYFTAYIWHRTA